MTDRSIYTRVRIARSFQETHDNYKCSYLIEWEGRDGSKDTETIDISLVNSQEEMTRLNELEAFLSKWKCTANSENERVYENIK